MAHASAHPATNSIKTETVLDCHAILPVPPAADLKLITASPAETTLLEPHRIPAHANKATTWTVTASAQAVSLIAPPAQVLSRASARPADRTLSSPATAACATKVYTWTTSALASSATIPASLAPARLVSPAPPASQIQVSNQTVAVGATADSQSTLRQATASS